jgi:hypothetical protein
MCSSHKDFYAIFTSQNTNTYMRFEMLMAIESDTVIIWNATQCSAVGWHVSPLGAYDSRCGPL